MYCRVTGARVYRTLEILCFTHCFQPDPSEYANQTLRQWYSGRGGRNIKLSCHLCFENVKSLKSLLRFFIIWMHGGTFKLMCKDLTDPEYWIRGSIEKQTGKCAELWRQIPSTGTWFHWKTNGKMCKALTPDPEHWIRGSIEKQTGNVQSFDGRSHSWFGVPLNVVKVSKSMYFVFGGT